MARRHGTTMGKRRQEKHIWETKSEVLSWMCEFMVRIQHQRNNVLGLRDRAPTWERWDSCHTFESS